MTQKSVTALWSHCFVYCCGHKQVSLVFGKAFYTGDLESFFANDGERTRWLLKLKEFQIKGIIMGIIATQEEKFAIQEKRCTRAYFIYQLQMTKCVETNNVIYNIGSAFLNFLETFFSPRGMQTTQWLPRGYTAYSGRSRYTDLLQFSFCICSVANSSGLTNAAHVFHPWHDDRWH